MLALAGCGVDEIPGPTTAHDDRSVIVGDVDWVDVTTLDPASIERARTRSVADLDIVARGVRCTGFLVARDVVMTNAHCVPDAEAARGLLAAFARERGVPPSLWSRYDCSEHIATDFALDLTLLGCRGAPGDAHGVLPLSEEPAAIGDALYLVHGNCDFYREPGCAPDKKLSPGTISEIGETMRYDADTATGSSGAPVIAERDHRVIAIHHAGYGPNPDLDGRGTHTEGVPMTAAVPVLRAILGERFAGPLVRDALEPNEPTIVRANFAAPGLSIHEAGDRDVFAIELPTGGDVAVTVRFLHDDGDIDVELAGAFANSSSDDEALSLAGLAPGTYELVVFGYAGATNEYRIEIDLTPAVVGDYEPNEDGASAPLVGVPFGFAGAIATRADVDVFAIDHAGGPRSIVAQLDGAAGDLDLHVYAADGRALGGSTGLTSTEDASGTYAAGRLYVHVVGYAGATGDYRLQIR